MNNQVLEFLLKKSLIYLKNNYGDFPNKGFIAGGSLANLVLSFLTKKEPIVNDIDVFLLEGVIDEVPESKILFSDDEDYGGVCKSSTTNDFYVIKDVKREGIWNFIKYTSNSPDYSIVLDSFDINQVCVGYSIEEGRFYYNQNFLDFLETKKLKVTNLNSPHHTSIRIIKKKNELELEVDEMEMWLLQHAIVSDLGDITRKSFSNKYYYLYLKYESELSKWFSCQKNEKLMELAETEHSKKIDLWSLDVINFNKIKKLNYSLGGVSDMKILSEEFV